MQRIKLEVFQSFFEKNLSGNEIDFLITLSLYQNTRGIVYGVHYKEMMEEAKMSVQSFYNCKESLENKGVIAVKRGQCDYDITIVGNDFSAYTQEDYSLGNVKYVKTDCRLFQESNFRKLKPMQKLLAMDIYRILCAGKPNRVFHYRIGRQNFYEKYMKLLHITKRTLQKYLKMLRLFFDFFQKEGMYFFKLRKIFEKNAFKHKTENEVTMERILDAECRRKHITEKAEREREDIIFILRNRERDIIKGDIDIGSILEEMLACINIEVKSPRKWIRRLKASLFAKFLIEALDRSERFEGVEV